MAAAATALQRQIGSAGADERVQARTLALSRWENEGGACMPLSTGDQHPQRDAEAD